VCAAHAFVCAALLVYNHAYGKKSYGHRKNEENAFSKDQEKTRNKERDAREKKTGQKRQKIKGGHLVRSGPFFFTCLDKNFIGVIFNLSF